MGLRDRGGLLVKIVSSGVLDATSLTVNGPCDALKSDKDITVDGVPAEARVGEAVTGYPIAGNLVWDVVGWSAITAVTGSSANVWACWYGTG